MKAKTHGLRASHAFVDGHATRKPLPSPKTVIIAEVPWDSTNLERAMGIEPTAQAWEAWVLPLYDARLHAILVGFAQRWQTNTSRIAAVESHFMCNNLQWMENSWIAEISSRPPARCP
jgi:hypothetical protein